VQWRARVRRRLRAGEACAALCACASSLRRQERACACVAEAAESCCTCVCFVRVMGAGAMLVLAARADEASLAAWVCRAPRGCVYCAPPSRAPAVDRMRPVCRRARTRTRRAGVCTRRARHTSARHVAYDTHGRLRHLAPRRTAHRAVSQPGASGVRAARLCVRASSGLRASIHSW